jgi:hypothetical protein
MNCFLIVEMDEHKAGLFTEEVRVGVLHRDRSRRRRS